jgi:hypothetical protein
MDSHGGLICTARAYTKFLNHFRVTGEPRLVGQTANYDAYGALDGTFAMGRQRSDGVDYAVIFNQSEDCSGYGENWPEDSGWQDDLLAAMDAAAGSVTSWPTIDPANIPPEPFNVDVLPGDGHHTLHWTAEAGRIYQAETCSDLVAGQWQDYEAYQVGDGSALELDLGELVENCTSLFVRVSAD